MKPIIRFLYKTVTRLKGKYFEKNRDKVYESLLERVLEDGLTVTHSGFYVNPVNPTKDNPNEGVRYPFVLAQGEREAPSESRKIKVGQTYEMRCQRKIIVADFDGTLGDLIVEFEKRYNQTEIAVFNEGTIHYKGERQDEEKPFIGNWSFVYNGEEFRGGFELNQVSEQRSPNSEYLQARIKTWMGKQKGLGIKIGFIRQRGSEFRRPPGSLDALSSIDVAKAHAQRYLCSPASEFMTEEEIREQMEHLKFFDKEGKQITDKEEYLKRLKGRDYGKRPTDDNFGGDSVYNAIDTLPNVVIQDPKIAAGLGIIKGELEIYAFSVIDTANDSIADGYSTEEEASRWIAEQIVKEEEIQIRKVSRFYSTNSRNYEARLRKAIGEIDDLGSPEDTIEKANKY